MPISERCLPLNAVIATGTDSIFSSRFSATTTSSPTEGAVLAAEFAAAAASASAANACEPYRHAVTASAEPPHKNNDFMTLNQLPLGFPRARLYFRRLG